MLKLISLEIYCVFVRVNYRTIIITNKIDHNKYTEPAHNYVKMKLKKMTRYNMSEI